MPMPSAYETRSDAFFRLYEGETPQEIRFPNCIGKPRFSGSSRKSVERGLDF